jgi:methyltransferase (TIGR00027 family)
MDSFSPSRTALGAATHRAAHQLVDRPPVFADPLAIDIVGKQVADDLRSGRDGHGTDRATRLRAFIAARSRLAEDSFADAMKRGVDQYVLLGAGIDTFAYRRSSDCSAVHVFEVDHPATQGWKRARLAEAGIAIPSYLDFVPVDFERETLGDCLARSRFASVRPAFFAWLGVTPYLSRDAIFATLAFVARQNASGSEILFDYAEPVAAWDVARRAGFDAMAARVAAAGEPFRSFFAPQALAEELRAMGFSRIEDFDDAALNRRYFANRTDGLRIAGNGHVMRART